MSALGTALRTRGRHHCQIRVYGQGAGALGGPSDPRGYVVLFQGETMRPEARKRGFARREGAAETGAIQQYPSPDWHDYPLKFLGEWARLARHYAKETVSFSGNPPDAPNNANLRWKVGDAIRFCFNQCGVPNSELDIPANTFRLWPSPDETAEDYMIQPDVRYVDVIQRFAFNTLGWPAVYDANVQNSPSGGMWRVLRPPQPP